MIKFIKKIKNIFHRKPASDHYVNYIKDSNGNEAFYCKNIELNETSIVIDAGGYEGEFIDQILEKSICNIHVYEPNASFFQKLKAKYKNKNIKINHLALSDKTCKVNLSNNDNASSILDNGEVGSQVSQACDVHEEFQKYREIDLLKLNIEGAEYQVLNRLVDTNSISKINFILVQFHEEHDLDHLKRNHVIKKLEKTHKVIFSYDYVWELFGKK